MYITIYVSVYFMIVNSNVKDVSSIFNLFRKAYVCTYMFGMLLGESKCRFLLIIANDIYNCDNNYIRMLE